MDAYLSFCESIGVKPELYSSLQKYKRNDTNTIIGKKLSFLCRKYMKDHNITLSEIKKGDKKPFPIGSRNLQNLFAGVSLSLKNQVKYYLVLYL